MWPGRAGEPTGLEGAYFNIPEVLTVEFHLVLSYCGVEVIWLFLTDSLSTGTKV
jgi:hypothetical protein